MDDSSPYFAWLHVTWPYICFLVKISLILWFPQPSFLALWFLTPYFQPQAERLHESWPGIFLATSFLVLSSDSFFSPPVSCTRPGWRHFFLLMTWLQTSWHSLTRPDVNCRTNFDWTSSFPGILISGAIFSGILWHGLIFCDIPQPDLHFLTCFGFA